MPGQPVEAVGATVDAYPTSDSWMDLFDLQFRVFLIPRIAALLWITAMLAPVLAFCWGLLWGVVSAGPVGLWFWVWVAAPSLASWLLSLLWLRLVLEAAVLALRVANIVRRCERMLRR